MGLMGARADGEKTALVDVMVGENGDCVYGIPKEVRKVVSV